MLHFLWGIVGILVCLLLAYGMSVDRKHINFRTVLGALVFQLLFAFLTLRSTIGRQVLFFLSNIISSVTNYATEGINFLFGPILEGADEAVFAIEILGIIIFFSSLISILYYYGVMQWIVEKIGGLLAKLLQTTKVESLSAAGNIFLGHTEAPLIIKPYMKDVSNSELFAIMTGGFGSVSGTMLVGYSLLGVPLEYLLAASFMSAPASLALAKIVFPLRKDELTAIEQERSDSVTTSNEGNEYTNVFDAASSGAITGLQMVLNIAAVLLAFVALISMLNGLLAWLGGFFGFENLTFQLILGYLFSPIMAAIGVPLEEIVVAGQLVGEKLVVNEFVAFTSLGTIIETLSDKTVLILSFALCGFANFGGIASQIGALGTMAPNQKSKIAEYGVRAVLTGTLVSLLNAAIAGMFF